jgi:hypothetical protein
MKNFIQCVTPEKSSRIQPLFFFSGNQIGNDLAMNIGQPPLNSIVIIRQFFVIDTQQM